MGVRSFQLTSEVKSALFAYLDSQISSINVSGASLLLYRLAGLEMKREDFPESLKGTILTFLQNNKVESHIIRFYAHTWTPFYSSFVV